MSPSGQQFMSDASPAGVGQGYGSHQQPQQQRRVPPTGQVGVQSSFIGGTPSGVGSVGMSRGGQMQQQDPRTSPNRDRTKLLLVIDDPHVDWSA